MNTEYSAGNLRIRFESRARRRWLVVLAYATMALIEAICVYDGTHPRPSYIAASIVSGVVILIVAPWIVYSWRTNDMRMRDDERVIHRREHAYAKAHRALTILLVAVFWVGFCCWGRAGSFFWGLNATTPWPPAVQTFFMQLQRCLLMTTLFLYVFLPHTILLWTEPDMEQERA